MSRVVFSLTDAQWVALSAIERDGRVPSMVPRIYATADDLQRKGWIERTDKDASEGRRWYRYGATYKLTAVGRAIVALAGALAAQQGKAQR